MRYSTLFRCWVCIGAIGALLGGCAGEQTVADAEEAPLAFGREGCFRPGQVSGFQTLDRQNLIVYAPTRSSAYHVRINPAARELTFADKIAFDTSTTRICGHAGEAVFFDSDSMARRYFVTDVYELDAEEVQILIDQYRQEETIEPQNNTDAEIERDIEDDNK
jgi:hypothetical protein